MTCRRRTLIVAVAALLICTGNIHADNFTQTSTDRPNPVRTTNAPTTSPPTSPPTTSPPPVTSAPTTAPVTSAPTTAPVTSAPTTAPVTSAPTTAPVTSAPTTPPPAPSTPPPPTTTPVAKPTPPPPSSTTHEPPATTSPPAPETTSTPPHPTALNMNPSTTAPPPPTSTEAPRAPETTPPPLHLPDENDVVGSYDPSLSLPSASSIAPRKSVDPSSSSQEEAHVTDDATNTKYIIILGSVIAGVVCIVLAAVLVRRRFQRASESDKSLYVDTQRGSMAFMESTRQSSVPVLQSNSRVYGKSHLLPPPTNSTPMQRSQSRRDQSSQEPMYRLSSIHHVPDSFNQSTNMTRISEAENSDGSSATTTSDVPGGFATDVRGTDDLCRFTQASDQYSEGTYDDDYGNGSRFPSDMSRETDWSIGSKGAENPGPTLAATEWGAPPPSQDHRTTDDLLYSGRSLISIDDSSVRGSSDAWLDSSRFNAIVSSDVHTF